MRKFSTFLIGALLAAISSAALAQVSINPATAWFNNETFEGTYDEVTETTIPYAVTGWKNVSNDEDATVVKIMPLSAASTSGSAADNVLAFTASTAETFAHGNAAVNVYKTYTDKLTGVVYFKSSYWSSMRDNKYAFCDDEGNEIFWFTGGNNQTNNAFSCLDKPSDFTMANRSSWVDLEFMLDLTANKIIKMVGTYNATDVTASDFALSSTHNGSLSTLKVTTSTNYHAAGLDNTTIAQLVADNIKDLAGDDELQTLDATPVSKTYSVTAYTYAMGMDVNISAGTTTGIEWSVSDWGGLSAADQAKVLLTRSETDYDSAVLTVNDAVAADATITIKAQLNNSAVEVSKQIVLKTPNVSALKEELSAEIATATTLNATVESGVNPYLNGVKTTLAAAIAVAQDVYDDPSADPVAAQTAITTLKDAETAFEAALVPYTEFADYIEVVKATLDAEVRDADFFNAIKATLQSAIDAASAAKSTVDTEAAITAAKTTLNDAYDAFEVAIPSYAALETAITSTTASYSAALNRVGTKFLNYSQADVDDAYAAISDANDVLLSGTTVTAMTDAKTAVETALTSLATKRNTPDATTAYRIYSYGESNVAASPSSKKIMYVEVSVDDEGNETAAIKPVVVTDDLVTDSYYEWKIVETATNEYTIQNVATNKYLRVAGLSDVAVTLTLPDHTATNGNVYYVDENFFFYGIVQGSNYLRQRNNLDANAQDGIPTYVAYNNGLKRYDDCFQFEEVSGLTSINKVTSSGATVVSVSYFDITGKATFSTAKGLLIKKTTYADGNVVVEKIMN